jgi:hypothetical protein
MCLTGEFARDLMFLLFVALFASNGGDRTSVCVRTNEI